MELEALFEVSLFIFTAAVQASDVWPELLDNAAKQNELLVFLVYGLGIACKLDTMYAVKRPDLEAKLCYCATLLWVHVFLLCHEEGYAHDMRAAGFDFSFTLRHD